MNDAIWSVIGDTVPVVCGVLLALYVIVAVFVGLTDGARVDRYAAITRIEGAFDKNE